PKTRRGAPRAPNPHQKTPKNPNPPKTRRGAPRAPHPHQKTPKNPNPVINPIIAGGRTQFDKLTDHSSPLQNRPA
ncbi:MAG: hypothetical protein ACK4XH_05750, partial [Microcystis sp.]|uniref:hypothetical protein n=1 Tax=Microcystis sp. TaxID=1127 RepID=UPI00391DEBC5